MNFLQLVQAAMREGGVSGTVVTVSNQRGEAERFVRWVAQSYQEICLEEPLRWDFLRGRLIVPLTPGQGVYSAADLGISDFAQWDIQTMRIALQPNMYDETFLGAMAWREFYDFWMFSSRRDMRARPINVSIGQDLSLHIGPVPDSAYNLAFEYEKKPAELEADEDVPLLPSRFHMLIVWRALRHYGMFESAPEVVARAEDAMNEIQFRMEVDQTPSIEIGGPLC